MSIDQQCIFCKIVSNKASSCKIWEDEDFLAFLTIRPINEGHTLLVPKVHFEYLFEMEENHYSKLLQAAKKVSTRLKEIFSAPRVGLVVEGFSVPHVHLHLVPVYQMAELDPNRERAVSSEELESVARRIREFIS